MTHQTQNNVHVQGIGMEIGETLEKYAEKIAYNLKAYLPKQMRKSVMASVVIARIDRAHGNKYEATIQLTEDGTTYTATNSTLNAFAALDIVGRRLSLELKKGVPQHLPQTKNRV